MLAAGTALAGCGAVGGIVDQLTGGSPLDDSSAFAIEVGDCFTEPTADADGFITEIAAAECSLAHDDEARSEEHTSELQSLMRISYAGFYLKKKQQHNKI